MRALTLSMLPAETEARIATPLAEAKVRIREVKEPLLTEVLRSDSTVAEVVEALVVCTPYIIVT